jgi:hypothetical protein
LACKNQSLGLIAALAKFIEDEKFVGTDSFHLFGHLVKTKRKEGFGAISQFPENGEKWKKNKKNLTIVG